MAAKKKNPTKKSTKPLTKTQQMRPGRDRITVEMPLELKERVLAEAARRFTKPTDFVRGLIVEELNLSDENPTVRLNLPLALLEKLEIGAAARFKSVDEYAKDLIVEALGVAS